MSNELKAQVALGTLVPLSVLLTSGKWFTFYAPDVGIRDVWSQNLSSNTALGTVQIGNVHIHKRNIEIHYPGFPLTQEKIDEESTDAKT